MRKARGRWEELMRSSLSGLTRRPALGRGAWMPDDRIGQSFASGEPVPDQELHRPIESDLRQMAGPAEGIGLHQGRSEAREAERAGLDRSLEHRLRSGRKLARKHRSLAHAIEDLVAHPFARLRR